MHPGNVSVCVCVCVSAGVGVGVGVCFAVAVACAHALPFPGPLFRRAVQHPVGGVVPVAVARALAAARVVAPAAVHTFTRLPVSTGAAVVTRAQHGGHEAVGSGRF